MRGILELGPAQIFSELASGHAMSSILTSFMEERVGDVHRKSQKKIARGIITFWHILAHCW
jgi:hypothetical protein